MKRLEIAKVQVNHWPIRWWWWWWGVVVNGWADWTGDCYARWLSSSSRSRVKCLFRKERKELGCFLLDAEEEEWRHSRPSHTWCMESSWAPTTTTTKCYMRGDSSLETWKIKKFRRPTRFLHRNSFFSLIIKTTTQIQKFKRGNRTEGGIGVFDFISCFRLLAFISSPHVAFSHVDWTQHSILPVYSNLAGLAIAGTRNRREFLGRAFACLVTTFY